MSKVAAALIAAVFATAALAACGGGGSSSTSEPSTAATSQKQAAGNGAPEAGKGSQAGNRKPAEPKQSGGSGGGSNSSSSSGKGVARLRVSGGGSAQYRTKGGDNSIQSFGEEGGESELQQAAEALHGFYAARAEEDWATACSYLAKGIVQQLEKLTASSPKMKGAKCPDLLSALTQPLPPSVEREMTEVDAGSLRYEGERAFLIYRGMENKVYAVPMGQEGGAWKVAALGATPLD